MTMIQPRRVFMGRLAGLFSAMGLTRSARPATRESRTAASPSARFVTSSPTSDALRRIGGGPATPHSDLMLSAADEIDSLRDALHWCAGSPSFAPEGEAREGWREIVEPLLRPATGRQS